MSDKKETKKKAWEYRDSYSQMKDFMGHALANNGKFDTEMAMRWLAVYKKTRMVTKACKEVGITLETVRLKRQEYPEFDNAIKIIDEEYKEEFWKRVDNLADNDCVIIRETKEGPMKTIGANNEMIKLKARKLAPEIFVRETNVDNSNNVTGFVEKTKRNTQEESDIPISKRVKKKTKNVESE